MDQTKNTTLITISKFISNFFNPLTSLFIYFAYFCWKNYSLQETIQYALPLILIMVVPISIWIFWNVKKGKYTNMDVSDRKQRKSLYFFIAGALLTYLLYDYLANGKIDYIMLFIALLLLLMQISNYFIKSSMHTAFNVFVAALFFVQNEFLGCIWLLISILVGVTRIILKRHSPKEVFMGFFIALVVSFMYIYVAIHLK